MEKVNKYTCLDCGDEFVVGGYRAPGRRRCSDCSIKRMRDNETQLMAKNGPFYEKWRRGLKAAAERL